MPIIQVSRVTARKGLEVDLPQPLAGAELGWSIDQRRLYIGNGELAEGAPTVGNTEILTEYSDILAVSGSYTYQGAAGGYTVQTGPTSGSPVSQSLQSRLDSFAVITDFGAIGDGVTDCTAAINRAMFQLYCRDNTTQVRRGIFFPAGTYIVSDTILIPPYALLYGEGSNSTIISFATATWTSTVAYSSGVLVKDGSNYYRSISAVPIGIDISNTSYWESTTLPTAAVATADSLQQTGAEIGTNGATPPQSIQLQDLSIFTNDVNNGLLLDQVTNSSFNSVYISGPLTTTDLTTGVDDISAVAYNSTASYNVHNIAFNDCAFSGFTYVTDSDMQLTAIQYQKCDFDTFYLGIRIGGVSPISGGPTGIRITNCSFDNIYTQGIWIENVSLNVSAHNVFYDVGNHFNGVTAPATSIIYFDATNNVSVGDMFQRNNSQAATYPRIELSESNTIALSMNNRGIDFYQSNALVTNLGNSLDLGTYHISAGIQDTLANNATATLAVINKTYVRSFKIDYALQRGDIIQTGEILVVGGQGATNTGFTTDTTRYVENGTPGVTFNLSDSGTAISFGYTTTNTVAGTIRYTISSFGD